MSKRTRSPTPAPPSTAHISAESISPPSKRARTADIASPTTDSSSKESSPATTSNAPAPTPSSPAPKLQVRLDITLHEAVHPPTNFSDQWRCTLDGCPKSFDTAGDWMRHVEKDHRGVWRFERKTVEVVTGYRPPPEEMFGSSVGGWRSGRDEQYRVRETVSPPPSPFPILGEQPETSEAISPKLESARWRQDTWVRDVRGSPYPPTSLWSGEDSWIRARDGPPRTPEWRRDWSPSRFTDYGEDEEVRDGMTEDGEMEDDEAGSADEAAAREDDNRPPPGYKWSGCDCEDCGGTKSLVRDLNWKGPYQPGLDVLDFQRATGIKPPPTRFELYGSFDLSQLPAELRNEVYEIAIEDAVQALPKSDQQQWRTQPLFQSSRTLRGEALAIYASTTPFSITFSQLDRWLKLVGSSFLRRIRKIDIAFAPYEEITRIFDFTNMYRLACLLGSKPQFRLTGTDISLRKGIVGPKHWSMTENHVTLLQALIDGAKKERLAPFFEEPSTLSEIYVNVKGQLISARATSDIWVTYEDLKGMFGLSSDFRLTVGSMPWQGTPLASTMAPRTTRANKGGPAGGVVKKEGASGGFGGMGSFGGAGTLASGWGSKNVAGWTFMQGGATGGGQVERTTSPWAPGTGFKLELKNEADDSGDESD